VVAADQLGQRADLCSQRVVPAALLHESLIDSVKPALQVVEPLAEGHECGGDPADFTPQRLDVLVDGLDVLVGFEREFC
jgi:hypothetical protein